MHDRNSMGRAAGLVLAGLLAVGQIVVLPGTAAAQLCSYYHSQISWVASWDEQNVRDVVAQGDFAYAGREDGGLVVLDISDPYLPRPLGEVPAPDPALAVAMAGTFVYVSSEAVNAAATLRVYDVSNPAAPELTDALVIETAQDIAVADGFAYLACGSQGVRILDLSDPAHPVPRGLMAVDGFCRRIGVTGDCAYVAAGALGLAIVAIADPDAPSSRGAVPLPTGAAMSVDVASFLAVVGDDQNNVVIIPALGGTVPIWGSAQIQGAEGIHDIDIRNYVAYVAHSDGMDVFDVFGDGTIEHRSTVRTRVDAERVAVSGTYAYLVEGSYYAELQVIDVFDPAPVPALGHLELNGAGDVAVVGDHAFIANSGRFVVADIASGTYPVVVKELPLTGGALSVTIAGDRAYVADWQGGIYIFDISVPDDTQLFLHHPMYNARNVAVAGSHLYVDAGSDGLWTFELSTVPRFLSVTDVQPSLWAGGLVIVGDCLYAGSNILELTDPAVPHHVGFLPAADGASSIAMAHADGASIYARAGDRLAILDVTEPRTPLVLGHVELASTPHDVTAVGSVAYVVGATGMSAVDVSEPGAPHYLGSFSTSYPLNGVAPSASYVYTAGGDSWYSPGGLDVLPLQCGGYYQDTIMVTSDFDGPAAVRVDPAGINAGLRGAMYRNPDRGTVTVDATVTVEVRNRRAPVVGIPAESILLETTGSRLAPCVGGTAASGPTGSNGRTTISGPLYSGGYSETIYEQAVVVVEGVGQVAQPLDLFFVGPDLNSDQVVNLSDVSFFVSDFAGTYHHRADLWYDRDINLSDAGLFAMSIGGWCGDMSAKARGADDGTLLGVYCDRSGTDASTSADPGGIVEVFLVLTGGAGGGAVTGWECGVRASDNLEFVAADLSVEGSDFGKGPDFVVGLSRPEPVAAGERRTLAVLRYEVLDAEPADVRLTASSVASLGAGAAVVAVGESRDLRAVALDDPAREGVVVRINGGSPDAGADGPPAALPRDLRCAPNPFNPQTTISFNLSRTRDVVVRIHDVAGRLVRELRGGPMGQGRQSLRWDGRDGKGGDVASGVYFGRLLLDGKVDGPTLKLCVLR